MPTIVQSVERAFSILETFDEQNPSRTAADIAELAGLSRPTTYRLLQTLQQLGYVRNHRGRFEITPTVLRLGAGYLGPDSLAGRAQPLLLELSHRVHERVGLGVLDGDSVIPVALAGCPSLQEFALTVQIGYRLPAHSTIVGQVLLAHQPDTDLPGADDIRARGYAVGPSTTVEGAVALAVPVFDQRERAVCVLATASVPPDITAAALDLEQRVLPALRETAAALSPLIE